MSRANLTWVIPWLCRSRYFPNTIQTLATHLVQLNLRVRAWSNQLISHYLWQWGGQWFAVQLFCLFFADRIVFVLAAWTGQCGFSEFVRLLGRSRDFLSGTFSLWKFRRSLTGKSRGSLQVNHMNVQVEFPGSEPCMAHNRRTVPKLSLLDSFF